MNTAILFDTMSIQQYVFGSNKLKDNLGASYIVEHIYDYLHQKTILMSSSFEEGYIGGGNALFFTYSVEEAKKIIKEYSTHLLCNYPGISVAVAIKDDFKNDETNYPEEIKELFQILAKNKGKYLPVNTISSHGITAVCQVTSLSVENIVNHDDEKSELISSVTKAKRSCKHDIENSGKHLLIKAGLDKYQFVDQIDKLGQRKGEDSHIAVVHIDGNGFGQHFIEKKSIKETLKLSKKVRKAVHEAFKYSLVAYSNAEEEIKSLIDSSNYENNILPIRPIILGGDDITFVCHGKLGIWFAEKFMEKFKSNFIDENETIPFSSCAGVAIVRAKYPFYRAYMLAEELCGNAKKMNKEHGGNWIDFQLAYSGLGNTLEEVRALQYKVHGFQRPYNVDADNELNSFKYLKELTERLNRILPKSKIKKLREVLSANESSLLNFIEHLKYQHEDFDTDILGNAMTPEDKIKFPFFDMIELLEAYPTNLLNE